MTQAFARTRTTTTLLNALAEPDNQQAWRALCERCAPIMQRVARRMGVSADDVPDVVQTALASFLESWRRGQYDRSRGALSAFLVTILRSRILEQRRRRGPGGQRVAVEADLVDSDDDAMGRLWLDERQAEILAMALDHLRGEGIEERTLEAFDLYAIRGTAIEEVAARLGMSREDVYNAKYRVSRRLKPIVARLDELYEDL